MVLSKLFKFFSVLFIVVFLNACTLVYKSTGNAMIGYAEDEGIPFMLAHDDVALSCSMVESFAPFLMSFSRVTTSPDQLAIVFYLMAGNCAEFESWEQELRYLRAIKAKNTPEAQDARIAQQRLLSLAAKRQLTGYYHLEKTYFEPGESCPDLTTENDQFYWLLGLITGLQAIINDVASGGYVQVPLSIAAKIGRAASCLDSETWWGIPDAIQSAIWMTIPGSQPADKNPENTLNAALEKGQKQGIAISHVLAAQIYFGQGRVDEVKKIIRDFAGLTQEIAENKSLRILNQVAYLQLQALSDRLWTQQTGSRTPTGKLGTFWDDSVQDVDVIDIDELL